MNTRLPGLFISLGKKLLFSMFAVPHGLGLIGCFLRLANSMPQQTLEGMLFYLDAASRSLQSVGC